MAISEGDFKAIMIVFIGSIIAATLIVSIADQTNLETNTFVNQNQTVTAGAVNATVDTIGRELIGTGSTKNATNATGLDQIGLGVFLQTGTGTNGLRTVQLVVNDTGSAFAGESINVSYTYNPDGYISSAGARSITNLIVLFAALAALVFVIVSFMKDGSMGRLIRGK